MILRFYKVKLKFPLEFVTEKLSQKLSIKTIFSMPSEFYQDHEFKCWLTST